MSHRLCKPLLTAALFATIATAQPPVLSNRYGPLSQGANIDEHTLNVANVNASTFGKLYEYYVDGAVYAQPLFVPQVAIEGRGERNVVYIATMNDKVYAFDASRAGAPLWLRDFTDERGGVTPVPVRDITNSNDLNVVGNAGIEGTPVIDLDKHALFLVARTKENGSYLQRLRKLDLRTGKDQAAPVIIEARVLGSARDAVNGFVSFDPKAGNQRPALALASGNVIVAWASHEDLRPYHGWIMSYDAATLKQTGALCTTPDGADGGIWQSGRAPAVDASGAAYFEVGNGDWDGKRQFGNSLIKVRVGANGLKVEDDYTPHDFARQNDTDADLGSTGPLLIPEKNLLIGGNKQGAILLLNPAHLGGMTPGDVGVLQSIDMRGGRVMAGASYWEGPNGPALYVWNESTFPQAFRLDGERLNPKRVAKGAVLSHGSPGGALTVSSSGAKAGTGILWGTVGVDRSADHGNAAGALYAFNAETLQQLWSSEANAQRDRLGTLVKFVPPLVVGGKVYAATYDNAVNVYGLLNAR